MKRQKWIYRLLLLVLLGVAMAFFMAGCAGGGDAGDASAEKAGAEQTDAEKTGDDRTASCRLADCGVVHMPEYGGIYIKSTIDDFNALGFAYGDSVDITFDNGFQLKDIPYYNGYYTRTGEPLLVAYPGYDYIRAAINSGDDLWKVADLNEDSLATVTLHERGRYLEIQEARNLSYTDDRDDYDSDKIFANFRSIRAGDLKKKLVYRSASPCDNQHERALYADRLMKKAGVKRVIDLADDQEMIREYLKADDFDSPCFRSLYKKGNVFPLNMNASYGSDEFRAKAADGMKAILEGKGPYLIHCTEGKDRTGFMCMLLEALCGASYQEIVDDYMITYDNYYGITRESAPEKYDIIVSDVLDPMIRTMTGKRVNIRNASLSRYAVRYLKSGGMKAADIQKLKEKLTGGRD